MARRREKDIIHQPDMLMQAYEWVLMYVHENGRKCLYGIAALCVIIAVVASYFVYAHYRDARIQYQLAQGIRTMDTYGQTRSQADIEKAEGIFKKIASDTGGKPRYISRLYLANINLMQGKREEALKLYQDVSKNSSNNVLANLANRAIKSLETK